MQISPIDRQYASITVNATMPDGTPATLDGVDVALLTRHRTPDGDTTWTPATASGDLWRVLLAGPYASSTGAIVVPLNGGDLWLRVTDSPEVQATLVERITVG